MSECTSVYNQNGEWLACLNGEDGSNLDQIASTFASAQQHASAMKVSLDKLVVAGKDGVIRAASSANSENDSAVIIAASSTSLDRATLATQAAQLAVQGKVISES